MLTHGVTPLFKTDSRPKSGKVTVEWKGIITIGSSSTTTTTSIIINWIQQSIQPANNIHVLKKLTEIEESISEPPNHLNHCPLALAGNPPDQGSSSGMVSSRGSMPKDFTILTTSS